jgi:hypothetical protein
VQRRIAFPRFEQTAVAGDAGCIALIRRNAITVAGAAPELFRIETHRLPVSSATVDRREHLGHESFNSPSSVRSRIGVRQEQK